MDAVCVFGVRCNTRHGALVAVGLQDAEPRGGRAVTVPGVAFLPTEGLLVRGDEMLRVAHLDQLCATHFQVTELRVPSLAGMQSDSIAWLHNCACTLRTLLNAPQCTKATLDRPCSLKRDITCSPCFFRSC